MNRKLQVMVTKIRDALYTHPNDEGVTVFDPNAKCICLGRLLDKPGRCCPRHVDPRIVEALSGRGRDRLEFGKWFVQYNFGWRELCLNFNQDRDGKFIDFEDMWYDGPHKAFIVGKFNIYWNW